MDHASCARQHWTRVATCDRTERRTLSTHLDLCVSSVTQKINQNWLRIMTPLQHRTLLAVQAIGNLAFNSCEAARSHHKRCLIHGGAARTRHAGQASPAPASEGLSCLDSGGATRVCSSVSFPMIPGSKPTLVLLWPFSLQGSRLAPARAVSLAEDSALWAASLLSDCIAASFIAALPSPDGILR